MYVVEFYIYTASIVLKIAPKRVSVSATNNATRTIPFLLLLIFLPAALAGGQAVSSNATITFPLTLLHANGAPWTGLTPQDVALTIGGQPYAVTLQQPWLNKTSAATEARADQVNVLFVVSETQKVLDEHAGWQRPVRLNIPVMGPPDFPVFSLHQILNFIHSHAKRGWNMAVLDASGEMTPFTGDPVQLETLVQQMIRNAKQVDTGKVPDPATATTWNTSLILALQSMRDLPGRKWAVATGDVLSQRWFKNVYSDPSSFQTYWSADVYARFPNLALTRAARNAGVTLAVCGVQVTPGKMQPTTSTEFPFEAKKKIGGGNPLNFPAYLSTVPLPQTLHIAHMNLQQYDPEPELKYLDDSSVQIVMEQHDIVGLYARSMRLIPGLIRTFSTGQYWVSTTIPLPAQGQALHPAIAVSKDSAAAWAYPRSVPYLTAEDARAMSSIPAELTNELAETHLSANLALLAKNFSFPLATGETFTYLAMGAYWTGTTSPPDTLETANVLREDASGKYIWIQHGTMPFRSGRLRMDQSFQGKPGVVTLHLAAKPVGNFPAASHVETLVATQWLENNLRASSLVTGRSCDPAPASTTQAMLRIGPCSLIPSLTNIYHPGDTVWMMMHLLPAQRHSLSYHKQWRGTVTLWDAHHTVILQQPISFDEATGGDVLAHTSIALSAKPLPPGAYEVNFTVQGPYLLQQYGANQKIWVEQ